MNRYGLSIVWIKLDICSSYRY